jgi:hypothetical protein
MLKGITAAGSTFDFGRVWYQPRPGYQYLQRARATRAPTANALKRRRPSLAQSKAFGDGQQSQQRNSSNVQESLLR